MRRALLFAALALLAGCGQPTQPKKQAEDLGSVAAEGALLAHAAADGSSTGPFTRVHAEVLREDVQKLEPKLNQPGDVIPWDDVVRADRRGVVVRRRPN